jgi:hypothetical protein
MSILAPALDAELSKDRATIFGAVGIDFAAKSVRLLDGSAVISFGGEKFRGDDPYYGSLQSIDDFSDGTGDEAPGFSFTLFPRPHGSRCCCWSCQESSFGTDVRNVRFQLALQRRIIVSVT